MISRSQRRYTIIQDAHWDYSVRSTEHATSHHGRKGFRLLRFENLDCAGWCLWLDTIVIARRRRLGAKSGLKMLCRDLQAPAFYQVCTDWNECISYNGQEIKHLTCIEKRIRTPVYCFFTKRRRYFVSCTPYGAEMKSYCLLATRVKAKMQLQLLRETGN